MSTGEQHEFLQERLEALHQIDAKLVSLLSHSSSALTNLTALKQNASNKEKSNETQQEFKEDIKSFYQDLQYASRNLTQEIRLLDDRVGKTDSNGITILPINMNKKATWTGEEKLKQQVKELDSVLS